MGLGRGTKVVPCAGQSLLRVVAEVLVHDLVHGCGVHVALRSVLCSVVVHEYHEGMAVPRQGKSSETGRVNQKRRTRAALVEA